MRSRRRVATELRPRGGVLLAGRELDEAGGSADLPDRLADDQHPALPSSAQPSLQRRKHTATAVKSAWRRPGAWVQRESLEGIDVYSCELASRLDLGRPRRPEDPAAVQ